MSQERERLEKLVFDRITIKDEVLDPQPGLVAINYGGYKLWIPQWLYDGAISQNQEHLVPLWKEDP